MNTMTRHDALKLAAQCKGTQHGYLAGAYTKLTVGKALNAVAQASVATAGYSMAFAKNTVVGFKKTK